jgi:hypothetical protein
MEWLHWSRLVGPRAHLAVSTKKLEWISNQYPSFKIDARIGRYLTVAAMSIGEIHKVPAICWSEQKLHTAKEIIFA